MKTSGRGVLPRIFIRRLSAALGGIRRNGFYYVVQKLLSCVLYSLWIYFVDNPSAPTGLACGFRHVLCFRKGGREEGLKRSLIKGKKVVVVVVVVFVVVVVGDVVVLWVKMACSVG